MEEEKLDVNPESSTGEEEVQKDVNTEQETSPAPEPQEQEVETSAPEVKQELPHDRPIENVAWEVKRKLDETIPTLQNEIRELKSFIQSNQAPQQPSYSKAQLMAYASDPSTTTEQRLWAYTEVDKLEKKERESEYERLVKTTQTKSESESRRAQAAQWVSNTFPDTVIKDVSGNPVGWNQGSPLLRRANEYIARNENLRNDPEGFMAAVKLAAFDLGMSPSQSHKINRTLGQLRKEQKKQLASSGGSRVAENPQGAAKARLEKLNKLYAETQDAKIFEEIVKLKGLNPFA